MKKIILGLIITMFTVLLTSSCKQSNSELNLTDVAVDTSVVEIDSIAYEIKTPKIDSLTVNELKSKFNYKTDEFSEDKTTWITPKAAARYRNMNGLYCYFSNNNLRFVFQYHRDSWLFIRKANFLVDGKVFEYIPSEMKRDNDESGITEWFDDSVGSNNRDLVVALSKASTAKIKLFGDDYVDYRTVTSAQIKSIRETIEYYKALGYSL